MFESNSIHIRLLTKDAIQKHTLYEFETSYANLVNELDATCSVISLSTRSWWWFGGSVTR